MDTPLLNALLAYVRQTPARFHMPGHKGVAPEELGDVFSLDVTELPETGDLYAGDDVIARAEALWADLFGFPTCQFLTNGSTQGIHTALLLCARRGRDILVDRRAHRAVHNAMALWDLRPTYLPLAQDAPLTAQSLAQALTQARRGGRDIKTVCITSPTYYGVLSDITSLAETAHAFDAALVVDGAHGCHLPFLGMESFQGADLAVCSAHKTLPVLGQGALLFAASAFDPEETRWAAAVNGTSSPSYAVMASMDLARARWQEAETRRTLAALRDRVETLKGRFPALSGPETDPLRLTILVPGGAGFDWKRALEARGLYPEMADRDHVVFLLGPGNKEAELDALEAALSALYRTADGPLPGPGEPWPVAPVIHTPRQALLAPRRRRRLGLCQGEIAAQQVAPYPPGVPVIAPGEEITKKCLAYLAQVGYNMDKEIQVLRHGGDGEGAET